MPEIIVKFSIVTGEVKVEAQGFTGSSCAEATKFLKDTLGESSDFQRKASWYESAIKSVCGVQSNLCG
jgi:hypothetical protein